MHLSIIDFRTVSDILVAWEARLINAGFSEQQIIVESPNPSKTTFVHLWYRDPHTTLTLNFINQHEDGSSKVELDYRHHDKEGIENIVCVSYDRQDGGRLNLIDCDETNPFAVELRAEWPPERCSDDFASISEKEMDAMVDRIIAEIGTQQKQRAEHKRRFATTGG